MLKHLCIVGNNDDLAIITQIFTYATLPPEGHRSDPLLPATHSAMPAARCHCSKAAALY